MNVEQVIRFHNKGEPYYEFTNFVLFPIELDGKRWPTSEHYYQAQKHAGTPLEEEIRRASGSSRLVSWVLSPVLS